MTFSFNMRTASILVSALSCLVVSSDCFLRLKVNEKIPVREGADVGDPLFLTPLINNGKIKKAQNESRVKPDIGNTTSYSGFLTVNEDCGNNLFFWFFPAQENWKEAPVVTWLQGGPGGSSLFGLFEEVGPFNSFPEGLEKREFSWNVKNNLLFFDQPVGTGFSFTKKNCYATNQTQVGEELYSAIIQFLKLFPSLKKNKFFITGESYAGHYIPTIGQKILQENPTAKVKVNLQALMIGDGWTDPIGQIDYGDYFYQTGLIDYENLADYKKMQKSFADNVAKQDWASAFDDWDNILQKFSDESGIGMYSYLPITEDRSNFDTFLQSDAVRKAIHVGSLEYDQQSSPVYDNLAYDMPKSVKPSIEFILEKIPIVFYNGQVDIICGYPMQLNYLRTLKWSGQKKYLNSKRVSTEYTRSHFLFY